MNGARVLVLGADSALGRRVIAALRLDPGARVVGADRLGEPALRAAVREADAVINATLGSAREIESSARRLFAAMRAEAPAMRIVHVSSMSVYGSAEGRCDESTAPVGPLTRYAAAQLAAETQARSFTHAVILRPGCEYGPDCMPWSGRIAAWLARRRLGDLGAGGDGRCNLVFIEDLVRAVLAALNSPAAAGRTFNVAMSNPPTWNEYLIAYALALGAIPVRRMTNRRWIVETRILAPPLKIAQLALGGWFAGALPPAMPPSFRRLCRQEIVLDVSAAEKVLGLEWTPLATGLPAAVKAWGRAGR